jgi:hypothetical protein
MNLPSPALRRSILFWTLACGGVALIVSVYWWAYRKPQPPPQEPRTDFTKNPTLRLENAPFTSFVGGRPSWALRAGRVDFQNSPGSALSNIQNATLFQIRDGKLYDLPKEMSALDKPKQNAKKPAPASAKTPDVAATFQAEQGEYTLRDVKSLPYDLALLFTPKWQFKLTGDVVFHTESGATLQTPEMILIEMASQSKPKTEQRVLCDKGVLISSKEVRIQANKARFNLQDKSVECLEGMRGTFKEGSVQAEHAFWSLPQGQIFFPNMTRGVWRGMPFEALELTLDLKRKTLQSKFVRIDVKPKELEGVLQAR